MSELTKLQTDYTLQELKKRRQKECRRREGVKQANCYVYENINYSKGIRNARKSGKKVLISQI